MERRNSKSADRSVKLRQAIEQEDFETFKTLLSSASPDEINKLHEFPHDVTCLQLAIQRGLLAFEELLLDAGAEVNDFNQLRKVSSIHLAMRNNRPESLELLLRFGANVNQRDGEGRTPLHILIGQWNKAGFEEFRWLYYDLLLSHPAIDINVQDNGEATPLELAVHKNLHPVVKKLFQAGAVINQHVRRAMEEKMPDVLSEFPEEEGAAAANNNPNEINSDYLESELWKALRNDNQERFQSLLDTVQAGGVGTSVNLSTSTSEHNPTLLQYACKWQIPWAVSSLLAARVDPNQTSNKSSIPALMEAVLKGNAEIVRMLVYHPHILLDAVDHVHTGQTALHKIAQKLHETSSVDEKARYVQCLHILVSSSPSRDPGGIPSINVNAQDAVGNTALHYAALSGVEDAVLQLLSSGANLGIKNHLGETAVKRIMPSTLEFFLDSCIRAKDGEDVSSQNFSITFDYSLLAPPRPMPHPPQQLQPSETGITFTNHNDAVETISLHNTQEEEKIFPECEALWHLSTSTKHQYLLKHPLITSFLMLKWHNIRIFYYVNVLLYTLTMLVLSTYILLLYSSYEPEAKRIPLAILWCVLTLFMTILLIRELFQLGIAPLRYLFSPENYIELVMIGCTVTVLAHWENPDPWRHVSAIAVLLAWTEGLLLLGRHPQLSIFITMFTTVSLTFLRLLLWYSVLLIGFGLSFFVVFGSDAVAPVDGKEVKETAFASIPVSLLKVVAMMSGELEYGDLPFDASPFVSRIIFLAFLFLITIVLLNLLNGMAVSDTQSIQSKAETIGYVSRVELISYLESMLLGDPFHFLVDWPPFAFIRRHCPSFSPLSSLMRGKSLRRFIRAESAVLFYQCLPNKTFTVYPRRNNFNQVAPIDNPTQRMKKFRLDEEIVQSACQRVQDNRQQRSQQENNAQILAEMERLHAALLLMQNQQSKLFQLLQSSNQQS
ncbi:transient receptor potential cation channel protein painless-like [Daphnia carinata]|uniref:transient receptor potential cation channel protein painless-like n=1 Tax=Daphnia carinata TaxID=120202 RepID=UPI00257F453C|nr:transient receptor potential cation channel protein painless-like [Daphnia carinata]